jgi:probable F420-dependent oxidoreductase
MNAPKVRVSRMIEHARVLRALFADGACTFEGAHYRITDLDGTPKPYRPGGPPFLIGGGGRRLLTFAAREADIVGVNASIHSGEIDTAAAHDALPASIDEKVQWVRDAAGARLDALELNAWLSVAAVTDRAGDVAETLAQVFAATPEQVLASPLTLIGSISEIIDRLQERRDRWGYSYHVIPHDKIEEFSPVVARLAGE